MAHTANEPVQVSIPQVATSNQTEPVADDIDFVPTTDFGHRLLELRRRIVTAQGLLDNEGLEREIAERRGGA